MSLGVCTHQNSDTVANVAANQSESTDFNARVGANIKWARQALGMTQAQLAYELTERGFPFQQQTILKVEEGSRPLRFEEAQAVAEILRTNTAELSEFSEDEEIVRRVCSSARPRGLPDRSAR